MDILTLILAMKVSGGISVGNNNTANEEDLAKLLIKHEVFPVVYTDENGVVLVDEDYKILI